MGLDIRLPIGLMFSLLGALLLVTGLLQSTSLNVETGAALRMIRGMNRAAKLLRDLVADRKPEAGAFARRLGRVEGLEDVRQRVGRNADSMEPDARVSDRWSSGRCATVELQGFTRERPRTR